MPTIRGLLGKLRLNLTQKTVGKGISFCQQSDGMRMQFTKPSILQMPSGSCHSPPRARHDLEDEVVSTSLGHPTRVDLSAEPAFQCHSVPQRSCVLLPDELPFLGGHRCTLGFPNWPSEALLGHQGRPSCHGRPIRAVEPTLQDLHAGCSKHALLNFKGGLSP